MSLPTVVLFTCALAFRISRGVVGSLIRIVAVLVTALLAFALTDRLQELPNDRPAGSAVEVRVASPHP